MFQIDLTQIIIAVCGTLITVVLIPLIKNKLTDSQLDRLDQLIKTGVAAAEQLSKTGVISKEERKKYVINMVNSSGLIERLKRWGVVVDMSEIYDKLEAAVYDLPNKITTNEVKKLTEQKVEAMADATVQKVVEQKLPGVMESKVQEAVQNQTK